LRRSKVDGCSISFHSARRCSPGPIQTTEASEPRRFLLTASRVAEVAVNRRGQVEPRRPVSRFQGFLRVLYSPHGAGRQ
jgi:hypothetical protein